MSHRVYLYSISHPEEADDKDLMMVEWGYELPLLFLPLLTDFVKFGGNNYNNHIEGNNTGLFYNAAEGLKNLKKFYDFLEEHHGELIEDYDKFLSDRAKIFTYLKKIKQPYFHLDAWDVFNMSDESHESQAIELAERIKRANSVILNAIDANDISLLAISNIDGELALGFDSIKALINYPDYDYGDAIIYRSISFNDVEIFEKNGLWGLKDEDGKIILKPFYDEFYEFSGPDLAVVAKDGKFGYVDKKGKQVLPLIYEDAYDFQGSFAVFGNKQKFGLISSNGNLKIEPIYDELFPLVPFDQFYCAKLNGKYGILSELGKVVLPFDFDFEFEDSSSSDFYIVKQNGTGARMIFSSQMTFIGSYDPSFLESKHIYGYESYLYFIRKHKYLTQNILVDATGKILVEGFEKIIITYNDAMIIRKQKKFGLFKKEKELVLAFEYDEIIDLSIYFDVPIVRFFSQIPKPYIELPYNFLKVQQGGLCGVYLTIGHYNDWVLPLIYQEVKTLKSEYFGVKQNGLWGVMHASGKLIAPIVYEEVINLIAYTGIAYGIKGKEVFSIYEDEVSLANKFNLQDYVDANGEYGHYYFDNAIQQKIQAYIDLD